MNSVILLLILILLELLFLGACSTVGFLIGARKCKPRDKKSVAPLTAEQVRTIERRRHEDNNFLNYDGSEQEDFNA